MSKNTNILPCTVYTKYGKCNPLKIPNEEILRTGTATKPYNRYIEQRRKIEEKNQNL